MIIRYATGTRTDAIVKKIADQAEACAGDSLYANV